MGTKAGQAAPKGIEVDLIASDAHGQPILLVEIKGVPPVPESAVQLVEFLKTANPEIPFGMIVDKENIQVFRNETSTPVCSLKTAAILGQYEPEFGSKPIYEVYLTALVESWLRDLAIRWNSPIPPASEEMASLGLLSAIQGGTVDRGAYLAGNPLR